MGAEGYLKEALLGVLAKNGILPSSFNPFYSSYYQ
jgi:hypothetical protein